MVQTSTTRNIDRGAAGLMTTPPGERSTESCFIPIVNQRLTITLGGDDPSAAGDYTVTLPLPSGGNYTFTYTTLGAALSADATAIAAAWQADPILRNLYTASAATVVVTLNAISSQTSIPALSFVATAPTGTTSTVAQTVAQGGSSIPMGRLYQYASAAPSGPAISGTPSTARAIAPLAVGTVIGTIRGAVAREPNSTELILIDTDAAPAYPAGRVFPGMKRGALYLEIDPASAAIGPTTATVYAVIVAGANTLIGSLTTVADGGNAIQVNTPAGGNLVRVLAQEETPSFGPTQRLVQVEIARLN